MLLNKLVDMPGNPKRKYWGRRWKFPGLILQFWKIIVYIESLNTNLPQAPSFSKSCGFSTINCNCFFFTSFARPHKTTTWSMRWTRVQYMWMGYVFNALIFIDFITVSWSWFGVSWCVGWYDWWCIIGIRYVTKLCSGIIV